MGIGDWFIVYNKESIIINKSEPKNKYIIVTIEGKLLNGNDNTVISNKGDLLFGEEIYLNNNSEIDFDIKCVKYSLIAKCKTEDILNHLKNSFVEFADKYSAINQLKNVPIFKNFTDSKFENILQKIKTEKIKEQDEQLNEIESSVKRIKQNAKLINQTIDDQKVYILEYYYF